MRETRVERGLERQRSRLHPPRAVLLLMIQQLPNSTDIASRFPALVQQALIDTHPHKH